ncbi:C39 family peptidase [Bacillus sp. SCS-151]|uniref:C39 family peptidase n=1 Tax=Nanhaiella sioensis TaxID=3115293 RepID=UPI003978C668
MYKKINTLICLFFIVMLSDGCINQPNQLLSVELAKTLRSNSTEISNEELYKSNDLQSLSKKVIEAPLLQQLPELPRGCEVTSLAMLLSYAGIQIDKMELAAKIPKVPYYQHGLYGDPNDGFVGDMYSYDKAGYAVYNKPIENLANRYMPGQIINLTGKPFTLIEDYLKKGVPVWVITTSTFNVVPEEYWETWETSTGSIKITKKEHAVLLTGFDSQYVYVNDPLVEEKNRKLNREDFFSGWKQLGSQAITLSLKLNPVAHHSFY